MKFTLLLLLLSINSLALEAPLLSSTLLDGKKVSSLNLKNRKSVIFFLSASCPCTKKSVPYLQTLSKQYPEFQFLGVHSNSNESFEDAKKEFGNLNFPIAYDADMKIADQFKATKTPHVFVLDAKNEILFHGGVTNSVDPARAKRFYLKNALEDISKRRDVQLKFAKALGCYIVR
ncbi:redoxin family protein [Halobacteriovorax sp. JY17]|uniref:redoxin family protein n=1 Tax=Halobacteriovorax sp. JY17 TaxID=2014617 RepID=UPI0025B9A1EA|nr:redoxin family protein [Halobacteriovorax sp. JY17]